MKPAMVLPMPCPISSLSGLWRVRVMESAMREVRRLSMEPRSARVMAGWIALVRRSIEKAGTCSSGSPVGTSPMTGVLVSQNMPKLVPATRAASVGGSTLRSFAGHRIPTARVTAAIANAPALKSLIASGHERTAPIGPPSATGEPRNGSV